MGTGTYFNGYEEEEEGNEDGDSSNSKDASFSRQRQQQQQQQMMRTIRESGDDGLFTSFRASASQPTKHFPSYPNGDGAGVRNYTQQPQHPRSASSTGVYSSSYFSSPSSPPYYKNNSNGTKKPSAPPRVSSLLPPPRSATSAISGSANHTAATNNTAQTGKPSLSTSNTITTASPPILPYSQSLALTSTSTPTTTTTTTLISPPRLQPQHQHQHQHQQQPIRSSPVLNLTHDQFATSFLDPLNSPPPGPTPALAAASSSGDYPYPPAAARPRPRSNSIGAVSDSFRNLNRWSSSTTSTNISVWDYHHYQQQQAQQQSQQQQHQHQQQQQRSFAARRMSVDSIGLLSQHSRSSSLHDASPPAPIAAAGPVYASPRNKLSKRRPSFSRGGSPPPTLPLPPQSQTSLPAPNLPPIISLPPLDTDPQAHLRLGSGLESPHPMGRNSPKPPNSMFTNQQADSNAFRTDSNPAMRSNATLLPAASVTRSAASEKKGHTRSRSAAKGSDDSTKARDRSNKPSQKAMLSKALSKANAAVQLDNAQNYTAARESYIEACELLQHVLARTNGDDDRRKLEAIQCTYTSRIKELDSLVPINIQGDKALPARPGSLDYRDVQIEVSAVDSQPQSDAATITRSFRDESPNSQVSAGRRPPEINVNYEYSRNNMDGQRSPLQSSFSKSPIRRNFEGNALKIPRSDDNSFLPAPLSPRRPVSPPKQADSPESTLPPDHLRAAPEFRSHTRNLSHESASWLDPIDESGGSTPSSMHSRSSSRIMRRHIRQATGDTEAEFDTALDAAIEAAYDEGYEPMGSSMGYNDMGDTDDDRIATAMRKVELAKERVRETEREAAIELAKERERQRQLSIGADSVTYGRAFFDENNSDEEEERMLEEMTKGYVMEDFTMMGKQSRYNNKPGMPRESGGSSGGTSRTWHSSMSSNPPTATTTLSTFGEPLSGSAKATSPPSMPPSQSLPQPPSSKLPPNRPPSATGVRNRRLSGQNTKQLKIETSKLGPPPKGLLPPIMTAGPTQPKPIGSYIAQQRQALSATSTRPGPFSMRAPFSPIRGFSPADAKGPTSPPDGQTIGLYEEDRAGSPSSQPGITQNFSTTSLKSLKTRRLSAGLGIDELDPSPITPLSQQVSNTSIARQPTMPSLPTPLAATFGDKINGSGVGGLHLFDSDFHSPMVYSPNASFNQLPQEADIPLPLEPCPLDAMFRPFWLMRTLYQTLAHPRGGYISNRLFVPRDAWKVKGVKLRNLEDKISSCDLLTAALMKLARVDSNDADAVLEEMQSFENILENVQNALSRKLGGDVGTQGIGEREADAVPAVPRNNSVSGKNGAFSWRRLRSKGSAVNLANTYGTKTNSSGSGANSSIGNIAEREVVSPGGSGMPSLPMVSHPSSRPAKRDVASVKFDGPYANYTSSLARLFDAAQAVDQIARQVDDPGLRHADKTQVGLELCTRHAAEFFGFYICRFVMTDLGMLLDKFVKRGSEWVLS
ncbi:hypothetical protein F5Y16DRAFT_358991 [Xylariaceae sp. FL0255]|nr:hypothetical protein F5Y16DRAFT_358991 [Xylariaceae sp. FL0255]